MADDKYEFTDEFERELIWALMRDPALFGTLGHELDPALMHSELSSLLLTTAKGIAKEIGRGPSKASVVVQKLRQEMAEGKITHAQVKAAGLFLAEEREVEAAELKMLAVPVLKKRAQHALTLQTMQAYGAGQGVGQIIESAQRIQSMGISDESVGVIMGAGSFAEIQRIQCMDKLQTGILELDVLTGGGSPRGTLNFVVGDYGKGKCAMKGTLLVTPGGSVVKVEDVRPGDQLLGWQSEVRTVQRINRGHGPMVKIVPTKGESFGVNREHVLTLWVAAHGKGEVVDVSVENFLAWPAWKRRTAMLIRQAADFTPHAEPPLLDPYILGVLLGDGSFSATSVSVCTPDTEVVAALSKECSLRSLRLHRVGEVEKAAPTYGLYGSGGPGSNSIINELRELRLFGLTGADKFVPERYRTGSRAERLECLAGLLDTDGHLHDRACYDYISVSERLASDVAWLARSVGLAAYVAPTQKGCQTGAVGDYWRVSISGDTDMIPCRVARKKAPKREQAKNVLHVGFTIEDDGEADYYGFTLDGDGRYTHADFTVTHNSLWLCSLSAHAVYEGLFVGYLSLELAVATVLARIKSALLGVTINSIVDDPQGYLKAERMFQKLLPKLGALVVHEMPPFVTILDILAWKKKAEARVGRKMDVLCVDYMDKLRSHDPKDRDSDYKAMNTVYEHARHDAKNVGYWSWTASQAKNKPTGEKVQARKIGGGDASDSVNKARVADGVFGISPTEDRKSYLINIDKFRTYDCEGMSVVVEHDRGKSRMAKGMLPDATEE